MTILVTGGCGFIGTNFIHRFLELYPEETVINLDKLTYAGRKSNHAKYATDPRYILIPRDINDEENNKYILEKFKPTSIIHFAAESHVDRSIQDASPFLKTNVLGTYNLLNCIREHCTWNYRFVHISTDEVYGSLDPEDPKFTERTPYDPRSPYAASKAASDHVASSFCHTHGLPIIITNCSNNYGPYQYPEKFIPVVITKAMENEKVPVYGTGMNIRDWIYVTDHCDAILSVLEKGRIGGRYNIGGNCERDNLSVAEQILSLMGKPPSLIEFVQDRKGHDFRYAIDNSKIESELGWKPKTSFEDGIRKTIEWYTK